MQSIEMDVKDMQHLNYQIAQSSIGEEFYVYRGKNIYEGPVILDKISKAGHCVALSKSKLEPSSMSTTYINHKQGQYFRSTIQTPWLARRKPILEEC